MGWLSLVCCGRVVCSILTLAELISVAGNDCVAASEILHEKSCYLSLLLTSFYFFVCKCLAPSARFYELQPRLPSTAILGP